jgi:hypothetical protein
LADAERVNDVTKVPFLRPDFASPAGVEAPANVTLFNAIVAAVKDEIKVSFSTVLVVSSLIFFLL